MISGTHNQMPETGEFEKNLEDLLPHRAPFVMLDEVRADGDGKTTGRFVVPDMHPLVFEGRLAAGALAEFMAQTAGAGAALAGRVSRKDARPAFIGAIKDLNIFELPISGQLLEARTELLHEVMTALVVSGCVYEGERLLASCELKIFLQD
jgi:predicted hotdog family 3-hydroxylacyl-ACP dehydratase